jgi:hypothetical protein
MSWLAKVKEKIQNLGEENKRHEQTVPLTQFMDRMPDFSLGEPAANEHGTLIFPILNNDKQRIAEMQAVWGDNGMYSGVVAAKISRIGTDGTSFEQVYDFGEYAAPLAFLSSPDGRPPEKAKPENDQIDTFDRSYR